MDEAMHPLTLLATGLYGKELPNQNGAPLRLVVPWKYGFKGIKSIVKIRFVDDAAADHLDASRRRTSTASTRTSTPSVDHPRWSQATRAPHRRVPRAARRCLFNGYADQVARLYAGMDLRKYF